MRISEHYNLGLQQPELEFLDVDVLRDAKVFVDPSTFKYIDNDWAGECVALLQDYYNEVLHGVRSGDARRTGYLLGQLHEPNETHLGLSAEQSRGSGVSDGLANDLRQALEGSVAVTSGLVSDVEDTLLFVDNIGHDRVSDMTINIVRRPLIAFTQEMCEKYSIEMVAGLDSGPMWNRHLHRWEVDHVSLPMPSLESGKLIMVPRAIVRKRGVFDAGDYLQHFVLPYLQDQEMQAAQSALVQRRKNGTRYVTKKDLKERDGKPTKTWNAEVTGDNPGLLQQYRQAKESDHPAMGQGDLSETVGTPEANWDALLADLRAVPSGKKTADDYHWAAQRLLTALLYPALDFPKREDKILGGRKRIDITFTNIATDGFFRWLTDNQKVPAGSVVVEAKNYTDPLANPEFDQLTGRFSPRRGQFGLLCYRGIKDDKAKVIQHCRDAALDDRGYVIALDDDDMAKLVEARKAGDESTFAYLLARFRELI